MIHVTIDPNQRPNAVRCSTSEAFAARMLLDPLWPIIGGLYAIKAWIGRKTIPIGQTGMKVFLDRAKHEARIVILSAHPKDSQRQRGVMRTFRHLVRLCRRMGITRIHTDYTDLQPEFAQRHGFHPRDGWRWRLFARLGLHAYSMDVPTH